MESSSALYTFTVDFPGPLDIPASLEMFRRWGDDQLNRWDGETLVSTIPCAGRAIPFVVVNRGTVLNPTVAVTVGESADTSEVELTVRRLFIAESDAFKALTAADSVIARLDKLYLGVRPVLQGDYFAALVRSITAQQVNLRWAATTRQRLAQAFGQHHTVGPYEVMSLALERLAAAAVSELRDLQFTTRKSEYVIGLARSVADGALVLETLTDASDDEVVRQLTALRGLGRWTAEWFLARALGRPCVVAGDLGVRKAVGAAYQEGRMPSEAEVRALTAHWGDAAGVAQQLLLYALSEGGFAKS